LHAVVSKTVVDVYDFRMCLMAAVRTTPSSNFGAIGFTKTQMTTLLASHSSEA
jgi:hypothetical protein